MPVDTHLQWNEIRDFTGGFWNKNSQLMPPNALQQMDDCFPAPGGGLKAWFKATTFTTNGVASVTTERARMLFVHENYDGAGNNDNYLLTWNGTNAKLYRMKEPGGTGTWTNIKTFAAGTDPGYPSVCAYILPATNDLHVAFCLGASAGADSGMWTVRNSDGLITHLLATNVTSAFTYQSRLCAVLGSTIYFTDAGLLSNIATNTAPVDISEGQPNIMFVAPFSPGDLLVFKEGAPIYLVEGDLNNYTVRQMNGSKAAQISGAHAVRGPMGVIFVAGTDGVYETPDGSQIMPLSGAISARDWQTTNPIAWQNHWLFCGGNGHMFDYDSHAWFNYTAITNNDAAVARLPRLGGFFFADNPAGAAALTLWKVIPQDGRTDNRAESYTAKTGPLRDNSGRQTEIRAVQVYARSFNGATSTVTVTVNSVGQTLACDSSGRGSLTFYCLARREELDITVTAASNASGVAAPDIEVVRFAGQPGHFLRQVADVG